MQARGFQIIQALRAMNLVDRLGYLQLDEDHAFDEQVNSIFPDHDPIVPNDHGMLWRHGEPRLAKLVHQCVFIDFLKNPVPRTWSTVRAQPMIRLDTRLTPSSPASICVFCAICGSTFLAYCGHNLSNSLTPAEGPNPRRLQSRNAEQQTREMNCERRLDHSSHARSIKRKGQRQSNSTPA
jgi:hypothetical protein